MTTKQSSKQTATTSRPEVEGDIDDASFNEKLAGFKEEFMVEFREMLEALVSNDTPSARVGSTAAAGSGTSSSSSSKAGFVTEDEIRAVLLQEANVTTLALVNKFKARLKSPEEKKAFAYILRRIATIRKTNGPINYVVLRDQ